MIRGARQGTPSRHAHSRHLAGSPAPLRVGRSPVTFWSPLFGGRQSAALPNWTFCGAQYLGKVATWCPQVVFCPQAHAGHMVDCGEWMPPPRAARGKKEWTREVQPCTQQLVVNLSAGRSHRDKPRLGSRPFFASFGSLASGAASQRARSPPDQDTESEEPLSCFVLSGWLAPGVATPLAHHDHVDVPDLWDIYGFLRFLNNGSAHL